MSNTQQKSIRHRLANSGASSSSNTTGKRAREEKGEDSEISDVEQDNEQPVPKKKKKVDTDLKLVKFNERYQGLTDEEILGVSHHYSSRGCY
jgi:hypothetical protein